MLALHAGVEPAPRRQLFVGTALGCTAATMLVGGMLAMWLKLRSRAIKTPAGWMPRKIVVPEVATNVMLLALIPLCIFAQWAVYAARRDDRANAGRALGLTMLMALAVINAQAYVYGQMKVPVRGGAFNSMFYAVTGTFVVLLLTGLAFTIVTAFRYLGGRSADREVLAAHALYWYFLSGAFFALWFVVYVTK